jgi:hypothetical protein
MPIKPCSKEGKSGHKWGESGTCYTGPGSRAKAARQGRAVESQKNNLLANGGGNKVLQINIKGFTSNVMTRLEKIHGVEYIVAPVNMIVEGVLPGSGGPMLYRAEDLQNSVNFWNNVPVTINHPSINGSYVSARSPEVFEEFGVGYIYNTEFDAATNTLKAEAWIQKDVLRIKFPDVYEMMTNGNANIEVSTGVLHAETIESGTFNGADYDSIGFDLHGDHLALLPNAIGACSWEDGCGLRANSKKEKQHDIVFNELDHGVMADSLRHHVDGLDDNQYIYYIHSIFKDFFVYEQRSREGREKKLYKQDYNTDNDIVTPVGQPIRVVEERRFNPFSEDGAGPSGISTINLNEGDEMADVPCCPEQVKSLIGASNKLTDSDESWLLELNEKQLESFTAMAAEVTTNTESEVEMGTQEYVDAAPESVKVELNALLAADAKKKDSLVDALISNENCTFEKQELQAFSTNQLEKMASLTTKAPEKADDTPAAIADMSGNSATIIPEEKDDGVEGLPIPVVNWAKQG